jgi:hypothetical protein
MTLLGIIIVGSDVNRSTTHFLLSSHVKKYNETVHRLFVDFSDNFVIQNALGCHWQGSGKLAAPEIGWDTSALGL